MLIPILLLTALIPFASVRALAPSLGLPAVKGDAYFTGTAYHPMSGHWEEWYWNLGSTANGVLSSTTTGYAWYEYWDSTGYYLLIAGNIQYSGGTFSYSTGFPGGWSGSVSVAFTSGTSGVSVTGGLTSNCLATSTRFIMMTGSSLWDPTDHITSGAVVMVLTGTWYKSTGSAWAPIGTATRSVVITPALGSTWALSLYAYPYLVG